VRFSAVFLTDPPNEVIRQAILWVGFDGRELDIVDDIKKRKSDITYAIRKCGEGFGSV
jgi:hypothetical protein